MSEHCDFTKKNAKKYAIQHFQNNYRKRNEPKPCKLTVCIPEKTNEIFDKIWAMKFQEK